MGDKVAFFYGTLMAPEVLHRVCYGTSSPTPFQRSLLTIQPAVLPDFRRHKVRYADYPAILSECPVFEPQSKSTEQATIRGTEQRAVHSTVRGTCVSGLTEGDLWRLDVFEGGDYQRQKVRVKILDTVGQEGSLGHTEGKEVEAETYVWIGQEDSLEGGEWDFDTFMKERLHWWVRRDEFVEVVEAVQMVSEDRTGGRGGIGDMDERLAGAKERISM